MTFPVDYSSLDCIRATSERNGELAVILPTQSAGLRLRFFSKVINADVVVFCGFIVPRVGTSKEVFLSFFLYKEIEKDFRRRRRRRRHLAVKRRVACGPAADSRSARARAAAGKQRRVHEADAAAAA
jgi:hypothetical protein